MKPTKLVMSAFGPFKNEITIDFTKLGGQGLFLVSGDTGSGKTTIFDAISFALFGSPSGEKRNEENNMALRSQYAEKTTKTFVELTFLHKGKEYFIRRNPQYMRPSLRGTGETLESQGAEFVYPDGRKIVDFRKVTSAVEELLGINWAQYKQIAMIAQGEFLELLVADSDKRSGILRKIFNTGIYVNIQERLGIMTNRLRGECEEITNRIFQHFHDVQCPKDNGHYESIQELLKNKCIYDTEKLIAIISELVRERKEEHSKLAVEYKGLEVKLSDCRKRLAQLEQINSMFTTLQQAKEEDNRLSSKASMMEEKNERYKKGTIAFLYIKPLEDAYVNLAKEEERLSAKLTELKKEEASLIDLLSSLSIEKESNEKNQPRIEELAALLVKRNEEATKYKQIGSLEQERVRISEEVSLLDKDLKRERQLKSDLEESKIIGKEKLMSLKDIEVKKATIEATLEQKGIRKQTLTTLTIQFKQIINEQGELEELKKILLQKMEYYNSKSQAYNEAEQLYMKELAGIMASKLQENMPCPVCGSTSHPSKTPLTSGAYTEEELKSLKLEVEAAHEAMLRASENCSSKTNTLEYKKEMLRQGVKEFKELVEPTFEHSYVEQLERVKIQLEEEISTLNRSFLEATESVKQKALLESEQQSIEEKLTTLTITIEEKEKENSTLKQQLSANEASLKTLKNEVTVGTMDELKAIIHKEKEEYDSLKERLEVSIRNHQEATLKLQRIEAVLHDNREQQTELEKKVHKAKQIYETSLIERGFTSEQAYKMALISEQELKIMEEEITSYRDQCIKVKQSIEELTKALEGKEPTDITLIKEEEQSIMEESEKLSEQLEEIRFTTNQNVEILNKVVLAYKQHKDKADEFAVYERLSKTANGNLSGKAKIAFEQYVQAFYFDQILTAANDRLRIMTNSQYELMRKDEATNLRKNTGLDIEVMDHYSGKARSVKTLSGGESFKAALSLALGLSDIIQSFAGGIEVDAMFVDEGFGSLDSNSLEQALSALNALTIGNRLVGIISHVNELKERIDKKILLEKKRDGSILKLDVS